MNQVFTAGATRKIAMLGNHVPRQCGIATFTADIYDHLTTARPDMAIDVYAMAARPGDASDSAAVAGIYEKDADGYRAAAEAINASGADAVWLQHEFGIFGGPAGDMILGLVDRVAAPLIVTEAGEDTVLRCSSCGYSANAEKCGIGERPVKPSDEALLELELVDTPGTRTIEQVTSFLKKSPKKVVKTMIYRAGNEIVAALIRGDRDLNEFKFAAAVGVKSIEMADADTIGQLTGAEVGFAGPVGLTGARIIADPEIKGLRNFVVGGNKTDAHYVNANLGRDFDVAEYADVRMAAKGDPCPHCEGKGFIKNRVTVAYEILRQIDLVVSAFFRGRLLVCLAIGVVTATGFATTAEIAVVPTYKPMLQEVIYSFHFFGRVI